MPVLIGRVKHDVERTGREGVRHKAELGRIVEQGGRRVERVGHRVTDHHTIAGGQPRRGELAGLHERACAEHDAQDECPYSPPQTAPQKLNLPHPCSSLAIRAV